MTQTKTRPPTAYILTALFLLGSVQLATPAAADWNPIECAKQIVLNQDFSCLDDRCGPVDIIGTTTSLGLVELGSSQSGNAFGVFVPYPDWDDHYVMAGFAEGDCELSGLGACEALRTDTIAFFEAVVLGYDPVPPASRLVSGLQNVISTTPGSVQQGHDPCNLIT